MTQPMAFPPCPWCGGPAEAVTWIEVGTGPLVEHLPAGLDCARRCEGSQSGAPVPRAGGFDRLPLCATCGHGRDVHTTQFGQASYPCRVDVPEQCPCMDYKSHSDEGP